MALRLVPLPLQARATRCYSRFHCRTSAQRFDVRLRLLSGLGFGSRPTACYCLRLSSMRCAEEPTRESDRGFVP